MPDFVVTIAGKDYTVTAPSADVVTDATRRFDAWLGQNPPQPEPTGPRVPNEGVTWDQEQTARQIDQFGQMLEEATRAGRSTTEKLSDWTRAAGNALTFGNFNEIVAGADAALGRSGMNFNERLNYEDQQGQQFRQENGPANLAIDIAGGLATPAAMMRGGASFLNGARPTASSLIPRSIAEGAAYGGVAGFGEGDGFNIQERLRNAGAGAATGGALGGAIGAAGGALANRSAAASAPPRRAVETAADNAYDTMRAAGVQFNSNSFDNLIQRIDADLQGQNIDAMTGTETARWMGVLQGRAGQAPTMDELDLMRRDIQRAQRAIWADPQKNQNDARLLGRIIGAIDDFVADPAAPILRGNLAAGQTALSEGRRLSLAGRKSDVINEAVAEAQRSAGAMTATPGSRQGALASAFRSLANDQRRMDLFSAEERSLINEIAAGGLTQNTLRALGRFGLTNAFGGLAGFLPAAGGIGGAFAAGGAPAAAGTAIAGEIGSRLSGSMSNQNVALLDALARSQGQAAPNAAITPMIQALIGGGASQAIQAPSTQALLNLLMPPRQQ